MRSGPVKQGKEKFVIFFFPVYIVTVKDRVISIL